MPTRAKPAFLLTRPEDDSRRFAALLPDLPVVFSPIIRIVPLPHDREALLRAPALVFTSGHAIAAAGEGRGRRAYCVGPRTAELARLAGFDVVQGPGDAEGLLPILQAAPEPLVHPHGRHLAKVLPVQGVVVYDQQSLALSDQARALLQAETPVILPLFSPRSARLVAAQVRDARAPLWVASISKAAQRGFSVPCERMIVAPTPDAAGLAASIRHMLTGEQS
ncbi:uroporphyrinogen-III synthase [Paracoccus seriniphilus]|uniref:Uroporphyrinogen-III synthase n=1 Tax=Paracoccus seriniphilus TaxID=184748 RepID=A0A239PS18_9RHOB|nr:uroporphyrinogen-III synthase [Paracoccus seriniphilus]WCR14428.1 uroporphyrinogen-III synthase [Paracoccus seriniphilus]SNT72853.1 uroporphyrinogen-III synthase [Paracoccus seriniphilus]